MPKLTSRLLRNNRLATTLRTLALGILALGAVMMSSQEAKAEPTCGVSSQKITLKGPEGGQFVQDQAATLTVEAELTFYAVEGACDEVTARRVRIFDFTSDEFLTEECTLTPALPKFGADYSGLAVWTSSCQVQRAFASAANIRAIVVLNDSAGAPFKQFFSNALSVTPKSGQSPLEVSQNPAGGLVVGQTKTVTISGGTVGDYALTSAANCSVTPVNPEAGVFTVKADASGNCQLTAKRSGDPAYVDATASATFEMKTAEEACPISVSNPTGLDVDPFFDFYDQATGAQLSSIKPVTSELYAQITFRPLAGFINACNRPFIVGTITGAGQTYTCTLTGPPDSERGSRTFYDLRGITWSPSAKCRTTFTPIAKDLPLEGRSHLGVQYTASRAWEVPPPVEITFDKPDVAIGGSAKFKIKGGNGLPPNISAKGACSLAVDGGIEAAAEAGSCTVTASFNRYDNFAGTPYYGVEGSATIAVRDAQESIGFTLPPSLDIGKEVALSITGGSGEGKVSFAVASPSATFCEIVVGTKLRGKAAGECTVTATKLGDDTYAAATATAPTTINASQNTLSLNANATSDLTVRQTKTVTLSGGSGTGLYRLAVDADSAQHCSVAPESAADGVFTVSGLKAGACALTGGRDGSAGYAAAEPLNFSFNVVKRQQTAPTVSVSPSSLRKDEEALITVTGSGVGALSLTTSDTAKCEITSQGKLKALGDSGSCSVIATYSGDAETEKATAISAAVALLADQDPLTITRPSAVDVFQTANVDVGGGSGNGDYGLTATDSSVCSVGVRNAKQGHFTVTGNKGGTCALTATREGNNQYVAATPLNDSLQVNKIAQTNEVGFAVPFGTTVGRSVQLNASGGNGGGGIVFALVSNPTGACSLEGSTFTGLSAGDCTVSARRLGDDQYLPGNVTTFVFTVGKGSQSITWEQELSGTFGGDPVKLTASASSRLAVSYTATGASGCSIRNNDELVLAGAGACTVTAAQGGNNDWTPATAVEKSFVIAQATLTEFGFRTDDYEVTYLTGLDLDDVIIAGPGNGIISFTADNGCSVGAGNVLSVPKGVGSCTVTANKTAGSNHLAGTDTAQITFKRASSEAITLNLPANGKVGGSVTLADVTVLPARRPDKPVVYALTATPSGACTKSEGDVLSLVAEGSCSVSASIAEDDFFTAASSNTSEITISKKAQQIVWEQDLPDATYGDGPIELTATATSELNVTYVSADKTVCDIAGNMLELKRSGTCSVTASQDGNAQWAAATSVARSFNVLPQQVGNFSFKQESYKLAKGGTLDLRDEITGVQGSGQVTFFLMRDDPPMPTSTSADRGDGAPCSLSGSKLTANTGTGTCFVRAVLAADPDGKYEGATTSTEVTLRTIDQAAELVVKASGVLKYPGSVTLSASGGEGTGAVSFALVGGPCTLESDVLTSTGLGTCRVTATKAADADYNAVTSEPLSVVVGDSLAANTTTDVVRENLFNTARNMLGYNPTTNRLNARRSGGGSYGALAPEGTSAEGSVAFSTSLQQMVQTSGKGDIQVVPTAATRPDAGYNPYQRNPGAVDIWLDGRFAWRDGADSEGGLDERVFMGEMGIDYLISENLLVGLSARIDTNDATLGAEGGSLDALGWMVGPYAVYEVTPGLQIDARLAYGQSGNDISVITEGSSFDGSYDTTRWLAEGGVRGSFDLGEVMIEPGLRAAYYRETADAFTLDNNGGTVDEIELTMMRLAIDPRITWTHMTDEGTAFSPFISPQLVAEWQEFKGEEGAWDVYGVVEGGLTIATENYSLMGSLQASGLGGDGAMSYSAGASITIPLN